MLYFNRHKRLKGLFQYIVALVLMMFVVSAEASFVVIGNASSPIKQLTVPQIKSLYLGKISSIQLQAVKGYNQPSQSAIFEDFYKVLFNWRPSQVSQYWSSNVFSGRVKEPPTVANDTAAIALTAKYKGVITYVTPQALSSSSSARLIRVLYQSDPSLAITRPSTPSHNAPRFGSSTTTKPRAAASTNPSTTSSTTSATVPLSADADAAISSQLAEIQAQTITSASTPTAATPSSESVWTAIINGYRFSSGNNEAAVKQQIQLLLRNKQSFEKMLKNATPYIGYVYQKVNERKMPTEIVLLPMIESGYDPFAYSSVGATGLWQMMPATAAGDYDLSIDWWYDQRRDIQASTTSALNYLQRLDRQFDNWLLALAAYNTGQGNVEKSIRAAKSTGKSSDYWNLSLPKQTRDYVPKLLAVADIIQHATQYGITLPNISDQPYFQSITINNQMDLREISELSGVSIDEIRSLNPSMRRWATSSFGSFKLLLPKKAINTFQKKLSDLSGHTYLSWQYHEVHSHETLSGIAQDYHTSVNLLKTVNSLKSTTLVDGQGLLVPIRLNHMYDTSGVGLTNKESDSVASVTMDDLLSKTDSSDETLEQQMSQLKLNQTDPAPTTADSDSDQTNDEQDDSLKSMVDTIYND